MSKDSGPLPRFCRPLPTIHLLVQVTLQYPSPEFIGLSVYPHPARPGGDPPATTLVLMAPEGGARGHGDLDRLHISWTH